MKRQRLRVNSFSSEKRIHRVHVVFCARLFIFHPEDALGDPFGSTRLSRMWAFFELVPSLSAAIADHCSRVEGSLFS